MCSGQRKGANLGHVRYTPELMSHRGVGGGHLQTEKSRLRGMGPSELCIDFLLQIFSIQVPTMVLMAKPDPPQSGLLPPLISFFLPSSRLSTPTQGIHFIQITELVKTLLMLQNTPRASQILSEHLPNLLLPQRHVSPVIWSVSAISTFRQNPRTISINLLFRIRISGLLINVFFFLKGRSLF